VVSRRHCEGGGNPTTGCGAKAAEAGTVSATGEIGEREGSDMWALATVTDVV
jgi:hypothetical protein